MKEVKMNIGWRPLVILSTVVIFSWITFIPNLSHSDQDKREMQSFELLLSPVGSLSYTLGFAFTKTLKDHAWFRLSPLETPGFVYMVKTQNAKPKEVFSTSGALECGVKFGRLEYKDFDAKNKFVALLKLKPLLKDLKGLVNFPISCGFFVTFDPDIKTPNDMVGKKLGLGKVTQSFYSFIPYMLLKESWGIEDKVKMSNISTMGVSDALLDGLVDVAWVGASLSVTKNRGTDIVPLPPLMKLISSGRKLNIVRVEKKDIELLNEATGFHLPPLLIPAGTLKNQDNDIYSLPAAYGFGCHKDMPEELAYEFTMSYVKNVDAIAKSHALGKLYTQDAFNFGYTEEGLHPGAVKAYKELGIAVAR